MGRIWGRCVLLTAMFLATTPLLAEEPCEPSNTIAQCLEYHLQPDVYVAYAKAKESTDLERQPTGIDTGGTSVATNTKDFNPLMALAGLLGTSTDGTSDTQGTMVFNLNFNLPTPGSQGAKNGQLQALVNTQPQLSARVLDKIPEDEHEGEVSRLEKEIGDLADSRIRLTYNFATRHLGRSFQAV